MRLARGRTGIARGTLNARDARVSSPRLCNTVGFLTDFAILPERSTRLAFPASMYCSADAHMELPICA